jgi:ABC-type lipoprotein release transport system permease subunit
MRFHWRSHLCLVLAVGACTAVVAGALAVGDSMRHTLRVLAEQRVGRVRYAMFTGERLFRARLGDETRTVPVLLLSGTAANEDGSRRANAVRVLGVDARFGGLAAAAAAFPAPEDGTAVVNVHLARRLNVRVGDDLMLRLPPAGWAGELALAATRERAPAFRVKVRAIVGDDRLGRFGLEHTQVPPLNVFVSLPFLQAELKVPGKANLLLASDPSRSLDELNNHVRRAWSLADMGLELRSVPGRDLTELCGEGVFLGDDVAAAALNASTQAVGVLCYLVNGIAGPDGETPYSFVAGISQLPSGVSVPPGEVLISDWLATDTGLTNGSVGKFRYFVQGPLRTLTETSAALRVCGVVTLKDGADATLMPALPGITEARNCRDWDVGVPVELARVRPKDEAYWAEWRGAPKAFVSLASAQGMWSNRWGRLTAVRYPLSAGSAAVLEPRLRDALAACRGPAFRPLREEALRAGRQAMDFGQLFLGLSLFLVAATLCMMTLLFKLAVDQRAEQSGLLLALGAERRRVRDWQAAESLWPAVVGGALGLAGGVVYARALLRWFETLWQPPGGIELRFRVAWVSLAVAGGAAVALAMVVGRLAGRRLRRPVRELLDGIVPEPAGLHRRGSHVAWLAVAGVLILMAGVAAWFGRSAEGEERAGYFFLTGLSLLAVGVGAVRWFVDTWGMKSPNPLVDRADLARRNAGRHPVRSMLISGTVACAVFLLVVVVLFEPVEGDPRARSSGTGGFGLVMDTTLPLYADLNTAAGRKTYGLTETEMAGIDVVGLRVRPGDDASCRNLSRAQEPRLLGVDPEMLAKRGAFGFAKVVCPNRGAIASPWFVLDADLGPNVVPAVADETTLAWGLGKSLGDELTYLDERGQPFRVRFVGRLRNSILQGGVVISSKAMLARYPSLSGQSLFLVDVPEGREESVGGVLSRQLRDQGAAVVPCRARLAELNAMTVMYLKLFQTLGGLGLLLGILVVALIVARNAMERRGELALMRAVGFPRRDVAGVLAGEQVWLVGWGLAVGSASALAAAWPALEGRQVISALWPGLAILLGAVAASGLAAGALAAWWATRASPLAALRME